MSNTPFMPLWVSDFLGDTLDLDAKEIGAYMLLLMAMWQRKGRLPADPRKLQRVARVGRDWPRIWEALERYFITEGDQITNKRLLAELQKVDTKRAVNAQSGARGGRAKALKNKDRPLANATVSLYQPEPEPEKDTTYPFYRGTRDEIGTDGSPGNGTGPDVDAGAGEGIDLSEKPSGTQRSAGARGADPGSDTPKPAAASRAARNTTCPADFWPDAIGQQRFNEQGGDDLGRAVEHFIDHWRGKGERRKDWQATWRTWAARGSQYRTPGFHCGGPAGAGRNARGQTALDIHLAGARLAASGWADDTGF